MADYKFLIDALNAITGRNDRYLIGGFNALAVTEGGNGGHKFVIDALNEITGRADKFLIDGMNAYIATLGGDGGHKFLIAALNEVVDLNEDGGGGSPYVAKAVQFEGGESIDQLLLSSVLSARSANCMLFSGWFKLDAATDWSITKGIIGMYNQAGFSANFNPVEVGGDVSVDISDADGFGLLSGDYGDNFVSSANWQHCVFSADGPNNVRSCAINGVIVEPTANDLGWTGSPRQLGYGEGDQMYILSPNRSSWPVGVADIYFDMSDTYFDLTDPANLAKFIADGKPVDPVNFPSGMVLFSGDASATGFQKNRGTLGDIFSLTASLTNASTSPSD